MDGEEEWTQDMKGNPGLESRVEGRDGRRNGRNLGEGWISRRSPHFAAATAASQPDSPDLTSCHVPRETAFPNQRPVLCTRTRRRNTGGQTQQETVTAGGYRATGFSY